MSWKLSYLPTSTYKVNTRIDQVTYNFYRKVEIQPEYINKIWYYVHSTELST